MYLIKLLDPNRTMCVEVYMGNETGVRSVNAARKFSTPEEAHQFMKKHPDVNYDVVKR